jgi:exonuclease III
LDIILLQETHWTSELETKIKSEWNGDAFFSNGTNNSRGVAVLISSRLDYDVIRVRSDNEGRVMNITLDLEECTLNIVNIYAPNTDNERRIFFSNLDGFISEEYDNIIGGDFNCILNARLDKYGGNTEFRNSAGSTLQGICTKYHLLDIWRNRHKDKRCFTWTGRHGTNGSIVRTRIDKFLTSNSLNQFVTDTSIKPFPHSDHDCVYLSFNFDQVNRGPGYWHFNNDLLSDAAFESQINDFWSTWKTKYNDFDDPLLWWDRAKHHFKIIAIRCAKIQGKQKRNEKFQLERNLIKLQERSNNGNTRDIENYLFAKEKLKQLELKELEATKIKTKARFLEEGERSTRYFFSLEKSRQAKQTIRTLTKDNLDTVSEPQDLLKETHNFYKALFTAEACDERARNQFLKCDIPRLPDNARESCEGIITEEELSNAVKAMENNKSPDFDGLTTNFYKHFWPILGEELTRVYNYSFNNGLLTVSQRRGIITLLFKKGDRTLLKNWRPVTLLNTDYKILTRALANRLQQVLPLIVSSDQTASIKGRTINDNTRLLNDVISYVNEKNINLALISVDQMKAFDRVSHDFLFTCLERFAFGPSFIKWIKLIYHDVSSSVKTNGWLTAFIHLERGLRQGCALSMPLYVLTAETMAINIRANPRIHGIRPPDSEEELKLSQYADDTTLLLSDDESIDEAFNTFDLYERASGAKINKGKCKGLWCGAFVERTDQLYGFEWYNDYIPEKILGLFFGNVDCTRLNWEVKIQRINNIIASWRYRELSYKGKALVINGLLTSTLWYNATSLPMPAWAISQIETSIYDFFWNYKRHLVNKDILALPVQQGGFNIPRIETKIQSLRLNTLRRLLSAEDAHWKYFVAYFFRISHMNLGKLSLVLDFSTRHIDRDVPVFHKELLLAWHKHKHLLTRTHTPDNLQSILNEPLFQNELITAINQPLAVIPDWVTAGVTQVKDICYEVVPGYLPANAVHEVLIEQEKYDRNRTVQQTERELRKIRSSIPPLWTSKIQSQATSQSPDLQPRFEVNTTDSNSASLDILNCKTRTFYGQLLADEQTVIPALDYWKENLHPEPTFNAKQWKTLYPPLIKHKHGDINWKIAHRVLPTASSLNRIGVYATPNCHRCGITDTLEHALLECHIVDNFWNEIQAYVDKITNNMLKLTTQIKLFGKVKRKNDSLDSRTIDLVNWTLTLARWAIHKSAVNYRVRNLSYLPETLFKAMVRSHLHFQFKLYMSRNMQYYFPSHWCLGEAFAKVDNGTLIFTL